MSLWVTRPSFAMSFLFGKKKTPKEIVREQKRLIDRSIRELDRERMGLQRQEETLKAEIKKMARQNQAGAVQVMAKDLVRTRAYITKFYKMKAHMQAVSLRLQTVQSTNTMSQAMKGVTGALAKMNAQIQLPAVQKIMQEFEKQSEMMDMKQEVMNDAMDDALDVDDELDMGIEAESDSVMQQVYDEIGLEVDKELGTVKIKSQAAKAESVPDSVPSKQAVPAGSGSGVGSNSVSAPTDARTEDNSDDLQARLDRLRNGK